LNEFVFQAAVFKVKVTVTIYRRSLSLPLFSTQISMKLYTIIRYHDILNKITLLAAEVKVTYYK